MTIAEALIAARQRRGDISQAETAELIGTSKQSVSRWEAGAQPGPEWVPRLAKFLELPLDQVREMRRQTGGRDSRLEEIEARLVHVEQLLSQLLADGPSPGRARGER